MDCIFLHYYNYRFAIKFALNKKYIRFYNSVNNFIDKVLIAKISILYVQVISAI